MFVEHGRAPEPGVARWQDGLDPLWRRVGGGCHLKSSEGEVGVSAQYTRAREPGDGWQDCRRELPAGCQHTAKVGTSDGFGKLTRSRKKHLTAQRDLPARGLGVVPYKE